MKRSLTFLLVSFLISSKATAQWVESTGAANLIPASHVIQEIEPLNDSVVWVITQFLPTTNINAAPNAINAKILRTTNGGTSWTMMDIPASIGRLCVDIEAVDSLTAWVTTSTNYNDGIGEGIIFATSDGGRTWRESLNHKAGNSLLKFFNRTTGIAINAPMGLVARTTNGGTTWQIDSTSSFSFKGDSCIYGNLQAINDTVFLTSEGLGRLNPYTPVRDAKFSRSTDGGRTWQAYPTGFVGAPLRFLSASFKDGRNGLMLGANYSPTFTIGTPLVAVLKTNNGGTSWTETNDAPPDMQRPYLKYVPKTRNTYFVMGISSMSTIGVATSSYTVNGGDSWISGGTLRAAVLPTIISRPFFASANSGWAGVGYLNQKGQIYKWSTPNALTKNKEVENIQAAFTLHPNPSSGVCQIAYSIPPQYLRVSDATGHIVFEKREFDKTSTSQSIDLQHLVNGVYFIELQTPSSRSIQKLVIQH